MKKSQAQLITELNRRNKKPRKPRDMGPFEFLTDEDGDFIMITGSVCFDTPEQINKLAKWLLNAAAYIEAKK